MSPYEADRLENGDFKNVAESSPHSEADRLPQLTHVNTTVTLSPEQFERLYLTPIGRSQHGLAKKFGNPTPL